jgi:sugar phosphate isomerase/epimerase
MRKHPSTPPQAFLDRLGHVHAHDSFFPIDEILDEIVDHRPLDAGDGRWRRPLALLAGTGYDHRVLLEVAPEQMPDLPSWLEMLYDGRTRIREIFSHAEARP